MADSLAQVAAEVRVCTLCPLAQTRTQAVPGEGVGGARVLVIGEAPGAQEDVEGRPFIGRSGQLLRKELLGAGIAASEVFITNVVKCRPPANRDPRPQEVAACRPYLDRQLALLKPALIATMGRHSLSRFAPKVKISEVHGKVRVVPGMDAALYPLFHPAAALRDPARMRAFKEDISKLPGLLSKTTATKPLTAQKRPNTDAGAV